MYHPLITQFPSLHSLLLLDLNTPMEINQGSYRKLSHLVYPMGLSCEHFFTYAFTAATLWYFFPGYIFQALSVFSWICWITLDNIMNVQLRKWLGNVSYHFQLESNRFYQFPTCDTLVDQSEYCVWLCVLLLVPHTYLVLHQHLVCAVHAHLVKNLIR